MVNFARGRHAVGPRRPVRRLRLAPDVQTAFYSRNLVARSLNHPPKFCPLLESCNSNLFSSDGESPSMSGGGNIPPSSQETANS